MNSQPRQALECGGKRSATPPWLNPRFQALNKSHASTAKAVSRCACHRTPNLSHAAFDRISKSGRSSPNSQPMKTLPITSFSPGGEGQDEGEIYCPQCRLASQIFGVRREAKRHAALAQSTSRPQTNHMRPQPKRCRAALATALQI